jgi:hypothetical protein
VYIVVLVVFRKQNHVLHIQVIQQINVVNFIQMVNNVGGNQVLIVYLNYVHIILQQQLIQIAIHF